MEKIKDFFYYVGDFIVCLIILSLMYFLITWKLDTTMPIDVADLNGAVSVEKNKEDDNSKLDSEINNDNTAREDNTNNNNNGTENNSTVSNNTNENTNSGDNQNTNNNENSNTNDKSTEDENSNNQNTSNELGEKVSIEIKSGMSGAEIAIMLEKKGLVESADLFVKKLESKKLSSKLYAGKFNLRKGMSEDKIMNILTGKN